LGPRIAIIGLGAIGGSVALALIEDGRCPVGYAASDADRAQAETAGVSVAASIEEAVAGAEIVLLAVPLHAVTTVAGRAASSASATASILHASSLQRASAVRFDPLLASRVFGCHPLAGTHASGFAAARANLFGGATVYLESRAPIQVQHAARRLWADVGAATVAVLDADEHDVLMARASHVPQLVATALAAALADSGVDPTRVGPGARDTTRLAGSSLDMWAPLLAATPEATLTTLVEIEARLAALRGAIEQHDPTTLHRIWEAGRSWRQGADHPTPSAAFLGEQ
jgi:prephenate dehydrogenase